MLRSSTLTLPSLLKSPLRSTEVGPGVLWGRTGVEEEEGIDGGVGVGAGVEGVGVEVEEGGVDGDVEVGAVGAGVEGEGVGV